MPDNLTLHSKGTIRHALQHAGTAHFRALHAIQSLVAGRTTRRKMDTHGDTGLSVCSRKGFGTLEVVIIIAVILSIALLFRKTLSAYATNLINTVFAGDPLAN